MSKVYREMPYISLREVLGRELFNDFIVYSKYRVFYNVGNPQEFVIIDEPREYETIQLTGHRYSQRASDKLDIFALRHYIRGIVDNEKD